MEWNWNRNELIQNSIGIRNTI